MQQDFSKPPEIAAKRITWQSVAGITIAAIVLIIGIESFVHNYRSAVKADSESKEVQYVKKADIALLKILDYTFIQ